MTPEQAEALEAATQDGMDARAEVAARRAAFDEAWRRYAEALERRANCTLAINRILETIYPIAGNANGVRQGVFTGGA